MLHSSPSPIEESDKHGVRVGRTEHLRVLLESSSLPTWAERPKDSLTGNRGVDWARADLAGRNRQQLMRVWGSLERSELVQVW